MSTSRSSRDRTTTWRNNYAAAYSIWQSCTTTGRITSGVRAASRPSRSSPARRTRCCRPDHPLAPEPLILFNLPTGGDYFLSLFATQGLEPWVRFHTTSHELVRSLVARGLGYSILS
ncbi:MAG: LysR substrate-binding domain-containing protein [Actinomycetia bacterium]|nr:LysR substrate-binding domain-containing protein [Actinomycetes bacterium]